MKPRDSTIDALKGLSIIGVLISHASFARFSDSARSTIERLDTIFQWSVPAFFFAAGQLAKPVSNWTGWAELARLRSQRLLIPTIAFAVFYHVTLRLLGKGSGDLGGPQMYFLPYLLVITLSVSALSVLGKGHPAVWIALIAIAGAFTVWAQPTMKSHGPNWQLLGLYVSSDCCGVLFQDERRRAQVALAYFCFWLMIGVVVGSLHLVATGMVPLLYCVLTVAPIRPLCVLGEYSGGIFLLHTPIIMPAMSSAAVKVCGNGVPAVVVTISATLAASLAATILLRSVKVLRPLML